MISSEDNSTPASRASNGNDNFSSAEKESNHPIRRHQGSLIQLLSRPSWIRDHGQEIYLEALHRTWESVTMMVVLANPYSVESVSFGTSAQLLLPLRHGQRTVKVVLNESRYNTSRFSVRKLKEEAMKAEAMSPRKRRRARDVVEIMAPLKHDCLFPLTTPTCQWVGHAAPETDYDFSFACVHACVCVCARVYHHRGRNATPGAHECVYNDRYAISVSICSKSKTRETRIWWGWEKYMSRFRKLEMD